MGRTVVIAGVGERVGTSVARRFAAEDYSVGLLARSDSVVAPVADELGDRALAVEADVTDFEDVTRGIERVREEFGSPDVLVHNASAPGGHGIDDATIESVGETWAVRTGGLLNCVRACLSDLRESEGTVVVSGTNYATDPDPSQIEWASAAGATRNVAHALREEPFHTTYVAITRAISPPESECDGALSADTVAERYWELTERDDPPAEIALGATEK